MRALVLDTGALIGLDRNNRELWAALSATDRDHDMVLVPTPVVAQAWRDGRRQARLAHALRECEEVPLISSLARDVGALCGATGTADVVDSSVAVVAAEVCAAMQTTVLTSDPDDLRQLIDELDASVRIERV